MRRRTHDITADYTYRTNEITENRGEQTMWLQRGNSFTHLTFDTDEAVATPVYIREITGEAKDFGFEQQRNAQKYKFDSLGFNVPGTSTTACALPSTRTTPRPRASPMIR